MTTITDKIFDLLVLNCNNFVNIFDIMRKYPELSYNSIRNACLTLPDTFDNVYVFHQIISLNEHYYYPIVLIYTTKYTETECKNLLNTLSSTQYDNEMYSHIKTSSKDDFIRYFNFKNNKSVHEYLYYLLIVLKNNLSNNFHEFLHCTTFTEGCKDAIEWIITYSSTFKNTEYHELITLLFNKYASDIISSKNNYQYKALTVDNNKFINYYNVYKLAALENENERLRDIIRKFENQHSYQCNLL